MKKQAPESKNASQGKNRIIPVLIAISGILLLAGIVFLLIEPVKSLMRSKITDEAMNAMESKISEEMATLPSDPEGSGKDIEATFVVPGNGNEVAGEEYDFIGDGDSEIASISEFVASKEAKLPKNVTLTCIGILKIDKINKQLPVWNTSSSVALRYGVGLYEDSVKPGQNGNSTIFGHNMKNNTLFSKLYKCEKGDIVKFIKLDGTVLEFKIDKIEIVHKSKLMKYVEKDASKTPQLTLVTCANDYGQGNRRVLICRPVSK